MALARRLRARRGSTCTATTSPPPSCGWPSTAGIGCIVVDSLDEIARADWLARPRPGRADPADPGDQAVDPLLRPDRAARLEVRLRDRGRAGRARRSRPSARRATCASPASTPTSARRSSSSSRTCARSRLIAELLPAARAAGDERRRRPRDRLLRRRPAAVRSRLRRSSTSTPRRGCFDPLPKILFEPGRSLVGNAGITVYSVGTVKEIPGVRTYVAVDGGMSDNLRPMLYGSRYEALIAEPRRRGPDRDARRSPASTASPATSWSATSSLADPRPGDLLVDPGDRAPTGTRWPTTTTASPARPSSSAATARRPLVVRRETYDGPGRREMSEPTRAVVADRPARPRHRRRRLSRAARRARRTRSPPRRAAGPRSPACCAAARATSTRSSPTPT